MAGLSAGIYVRRNGYKAEKKKILDTTIAQLEQVLPGISSQIEVSDVATPCTTFRYTKNWKAALGFILTKTLAADMVMKPQYELPGLDDFYMITLKATNRINRRIVFASSWEFKTENEMGPVCKKIAQDISGKL